MVMSLFMHVISNLSVMILISFQFISFSKSLNKFHNFGSDWLDILKNTSYEIKVCNSSNTAVAVSYKGNTFGVTVAHMNCSDTGCPFGLVGCEGIDVALDFRECPPVKLVLDASLYSPPMVGDDVCVYGGFGAYGNIRNYRETIGVL